MRVIVAALGPATAASLRPGLVGEPEVDWLPRFTRSVRRSKLAAFMHPDRLLLEEHLYDEWSPNLVHPRRPRFWR